MPTVTLRGLDDEEAEKLRQEARRQGVSLNALLMRLIREGSGLCRKRRRPRHHELDALAGTWSAADAEQFAAAIVDVERVDDEMWR